MKTTVHIHSAILFKILEASRLNEMTRSEIILKLMNNVIRDISKPIIGGKMVKYQERRKPNDWHTVHLELREDEYEYLLDLRRLLKLSVSLILANAVDKYLMKVEKIIQSDKYLMRNYVLIQEINNGTLHWRHIWGFPSNIGDLTSCVTVSRGT